MEHCFAIFDTAIGSCGIAWGKSGVIGVSLPSDDANATRQVISARFPAAAESEPTKAVAAAIESIQALLNGEARDLLEIELDLDGITAFNKRVYELTRRIPPGRTLTYGQIADRLKAPGTARAIGQAMGSNPFPIIVPCHRVMASSGGAGGFSAPGGVETKMKILNIERIHAPQEATLFADLPLAVRPRRPSGRRR